MPTACSGPGSVHAPDEESRPATPHLVGVIEPLVSIIVPIYDRTAEIIRLARSIYEQDYPWIEVVFISNGSPPETNEAIRATENYLMKRRFRVRIIELARAYGSATIPRDLGIRASSGDLICVLDSDDWLDPGFFTFLRQGPWRNDTLYYPKKVFHDHGRAMGDSFLFEQTISGLGTLESADLISALRRTRQLHEQLGGLLRPRSVQPRRGDRPPAELRRGSLSLVALRTGRWPGRGARRTCEHLAPPRE